MLLDLLPVILGLDHFRFREGQPSILTHENYSRFAFASCNFSPRTIALSPKFSIILAIARAFAQQDPKILKTTTTCCTRHDARTKIVLGGPKSRIKENADRKWPKFSLPDSP